MGIIVQKYGGTSVATEGTRLKVYKKVIKAKNKGDSVIVVVSAMGKSGDSYATDTILDLIRKNIKNYNLRELDMAFVCGEMISAAIVASKLNEIGYKAMSINGMQAGIYTDGVYFDADIRRIDKSKMQKHLDEGYILVVTGGQGITEDKEITTLGRGGSDTTATALGVAFGAYETIIYTDVKGLMSADPRIIEKPDIVREISYDNCCKLADKGAKVIHPRAVREAMKDKKMKLYVRSTFSEDEGTLIGDFEDSNKSEIISITKKETDNKKLSKVTLVGSKLCGIKSLILDTSKDIKKYDVIFEEKYVSFIVDSLNADALIKKLHGLKIC